MVVRKQKRSRKQRGKSSHGWGFSKRHRGKGHKGSSGHGKRGAHREGMFYSRGEEPLGKHGMQFKPRVFKLPVKTVSLEMIDRNVQSWGKKEGNMFEIDLTKLGYTKVLSDGKINHKLKIICHKFSESAKKKIEGAGGQAIQPK